MEASFSHPVRTEWKLLAQLKVDHPAITQEECAKQLGVSANTIRHWQKTPLYQSFENWFINKNFDSLPLSVKRKREDVQEELDEFAQEMLSRLRDIVETSPDTKLVASIGFDALDRAGYGAVKKDNARPINFILTADALIELSRRARDVNAVEGVVVGQGEVVEKVG